MLQDFEENSILLTQAPTNEEQHMNEEAEFDERVTFDVIVLLVHLAQSTQEPTPTRDSSSLDAINTQGYAVIKAHAKIKLLEAELQKYKRDESKMKMLMEEVKVASELILLEKDKEINSLIEEKTAMQETIEELQNIIEKLKYKVEEHENEKATEAVEEKPLGDDKAGTEEQVQRTAVEKEADNDKSEEVLKGEPPSMIIRIKCKEKRLREDSQFTELKTAKRNKKTPTISPVPLQLEQSTIHVGEKLLTELPVARKKAPTKKRKAIHEDDQDLMFFVDEITKEKLKKSNRKHRVW